MSGHVVCFENQPKSISDQIGIITKYKLIPEVCEFPRALGNFLEDDELEKDQVKAFVLDMHDKKVHNLAELNLPRVDTMSGEAVGLALAERYLKRPNSPFRRVPVAFLTGYEIHRPVQKRIEELKQKGGEVVTFKKEDDLKRFEEFIRKIVGVGDSIELDPKKRSNFELLDYREGFQIARGIAADFKLAEDQEAFLFGYIIKSKGDWANIIRSVQTATSIHADVRARSEAIMDVKTSLETVVGRSLAAQRRWMNLPMDALDGSRPIELLKSNDMHSLVKLVGFLRGITG